MKPLRRLAFVTVAASLALGLSACGDSAPAAGEVPEGKAIAAIAAPAGQAWTDVVTVTKDGGYQMGNPDAPIKLVEYGSLTCPACAAFANEATEPLKTKYIDSGRVSFEFRSVLIHGTVDLVLTRMVQCGAPEAVIPRSDQVWANLNSVLDPVQANSAAIEQGMKLPENQRFVAFAQAGGLLDFFAGSGLSRDQASQCLADFESMNKLAELSEKTATRDGIVSTPTFIINGSNVGPQSWTSLEPMLQRAGAR